MKTSRMLILAMAAMLNAGRLWASIIGYEFDWTPQSGYSQYDASFIYSGGTISGGVFTPTGLITYSIGTPFGTSTAASGPGLSFFTDTKYGPSFQVGGTVEPIDYANNPVDPDSEVFEGNNLALYFQGETDFISYFQNGANHDVNLTGTWTETVITTPDSVDSLLLLGLGLACVALFGLCCSGRVRVPGNSR